MGDGDYYEEDDWNNEDWNQPLYLLVLVACASFYFQALVTEERFVPALNVISKAFKISDDVAGATLMAAGASSPEMFSAFVSVFITHSALGIGTVVGSEIFNQLVITAFAIYASKNQRLILDPTSIMRDVIFYGLSLLCFYNSLTDRRVVDDDGTAYVFVSKFDAALLVGCYVLYVIVCAKYDMILSFLNIKTAKDTDEDGQHYEAFDEQLEGGIVKTQLSLSSVVSMPFVRSCGGREPTQNFIDSLDEEDDKSIGSTSSTVTELFAEKDGMACRSCHGFKPTKFLMDNIAPNNGAIEGINEIQRDANGTHLYLWQRSTFYDKARIGMNAWFLRYFTFSNGKVTSVPVRNGSDVMDEDTIIFPHFKSFDVDETRLMIKMTTMKRDYVLLAPTRAHLDAAMPCFEESLDRNTVETDKEHDFLSEPHESLISFPKGMSIIQLFFSTITFPLKAVIHFTIPDVRNKSSLSPTVRASVAIIACILALVVGSYAMVESLEDVGAILNIPPSIIGVTLSAAGTSLPNLVSSTCAARLGLGNMAIANVFGSNTFNILIGLGLPWLLYTIMYDDYYSDLPAGRINESMIVMVVALALFLVLVFQSGFVLVKWHAWLFGILYVGFIVNTFAQTY